MAIWYIDPENGNDANTFASFAQRGRTLSGLTAGKGLAAGDEIRLIGSTDPTDTGVSATFTNESPTITLASPITQDIYMEGAWTGVTNVTATVNTTTNIQGANCSSLAIAAAFTTGKVGHYATGTLDLSTYQQISFSFRTNIAVVANTFRVDLCSDTTGNTPVHSFTLNRAMQANTWAKFVFDNGSAMSSSIQSIAITALLDPGTVTVLFDACWASTAPGSATAITARSLVGKNTVGDPLFYAVKFVQGSTVYIDIFPNLVITTASQRGYTGTTESVNIWHRGTVVVDPTATNATLNLAQVNGTFAAPITLSGGWNRTDMSTQSLQCTWLDGMDGLGNGISLGVLGTSTISNWNLSKINFVRFGRGLLHDGRACNYLGDLFITACTQSSGPLLVSNQSLNGVDSAIDSEICVGARLFLYANGAIVQFGGVRCRYGSIYLYGHSGTALGLLTGSDNYAENYEIRNCVSGAIMFGGTQAQQAMGSWVINNVDHYPNSGTDSNPAISGPATPCAGKLVVNNLNMRGAIRLALFPTNPGIHIRRLNILSFAGGANTLVAVSPTTPGGYVSAYVESCPGNLDVLGLGDGPWYNGKTIQWFSGNYGNSGGSFSTDNSVVHSTNSESWKFSIWDAQSSNASNVFNSRDPYVVYCPANKTLTFTAWVRRASVADLMIRLRVRGGAHKGIPSDVVANAVSVTDNAWEQLSISVTPTANEFIEIWPECYSLRRIAGSFTVSAPIKAWIDDLDWSIG